MTQKKSVTIAGHRTSISLEPEFWECLGEIANRRDCSIASLIAEIDKNRLQKSDMENLSSAIRVFIVQTLRHNLD
ncbi:MAG: ribbon-helix-helix domain-containing protein [bacterium]